MLSACERLICEPLLAMSPAFLGLLCTALFLTGSGSFLDLETALMDSCDRFVLEPVGGALRAGLEIETPGLLGLVLLVVEYLLLLPFIAPMTPLMGGSSSPSSYPEPP